jgi:predicted NBD/HSP70 family sugar kinase
VGGHGIAVRARELARDYPDSALWRLAGGNPGTIEAIHVFEAAGAGDLIARGIVTELCAALGMSLAAVMHSVNPELIIVTGGVARSLAPLEAEILGHAARYALPRVFATTRVAIVAGDKRRSFMGGAALVLYQVGRRSGPVATAR